MRERGIIFSGPMVRALLADRKTQTRRIVKPMKTAPLPDTWDTEAFGPLKFTGLDSLGYGGLVAKKEGARHVFPLPRCPYGVPGDHLWVREAWAHCRNVEDPTGTGEHFTVSCTVGKGTHVIYRADLDDDEAKHISPWRSPIHMFRWGSRITLELTAVRTERVQEISEADAEAEGMNLSIVNPGDRTSFIPEFADIFQAINGGPHAWESNPLVWVLSFRPVEVGE